ncbi:response regulator [Flavobacterium phycosphaerae]|uniref:response regulator n=1 Tax=Flavobacterium phycosphaerae TaxID=2697515 RepID=UPI00138AC2D0|nr:response regulator [Flavobacterium phycosphaerae]
METSLSIFYLNNSHDDLASFKNVAEELGNKVLVFKGGYEMLQALRSQTTTPDMIFLDTHMPIVNGEEVLEVLKKSREWKNIPVVIVSGAFPKKLARHFFQMGANYLMKKHHNPNYKNDITQALQINLHKPQAAS